MGSPEMGGIMARFMGEIDGGRGSVHRLGHAKSGIRAHVRGWDSGVRIEAFVTVDGADGFYVYVTSGSNGGRADVLIASIMGETVRTFNAAGVAS